MTHDDGFGWVTWKQLKEDYGWPYTRQHTWRLIKLGRFPKPSKFGSHPHCRVAWRRIDLIAFFNSQHQRAA